MATDDSDPERNVRLVVQMLMTANEADAAALAIVLGVSRKSVYDRLSGKRRFSVRDLGRLARHWNIEPGVFFAEPRTLIGSATVPNRHTVGLRAWAGQTASPVPEKAA